MTFALLLFSRGFEWMIGLENAFTAESKKLGVTPVVLDANSPDQNQLAQIEAQVQRFAADPQAEVQVVELL